jgi:hypothetical protein
LTPHGYNPIKTFDPTKPALLHEQLNDAVIPWEGTADEIASWRKHASRYDSDEVMEWDGLLIDGWATPPSG